MINLALAELDRLRSRRVVLVWMIVLLVALAGFQVIAGFSVKQPSQQEIAAARQQFQQARHDYDQNHDSDVKQCQEANPGQPADLCDYPAPSWEDYRPRAATFADMAGAGVTITVIFSALTFLVVGASLIGAEYGSGAIANWLSFIPDRVRVYTSKLGVLILVSAAAGAVAAGLTLACTALLVKINDGRVLQLTDTAAAGARGLIVVVVCATVGFALALISRHTIAALGAVVGYLVFDFVLNIVMSAFDPVQRIKPWLPEYNARAVVDHGIRYQDQVRHLTPDGINYTSIERELGFGHGLTYLIVVFAIAVAVSLLVFRRRDVT
ncbi:ABC transporter permease subunit [Microlunatus sp. Gsoil 973]|uniref:ABC transporter permease subunit n=1 Tax=Microlunatus sp. Gsoil 973 TaxID=2672569 RepID=UPI0012B4E1FA|nr:ABC transporter permease subunit [Microlunatus sp. Gsoil 973]QGN33374.1 ABC transporter permease subunit [Microlunatus sp. Gsoil 973]